MKKLILYMMMFLISILVGFFTLVGFNDKDKLILKGTGVTVYADNPVEERPTDFIQNAANMIGKTFIVNGIIKEAYKDKSNELVLYVKDKNIPLMINCTLNNSDFQIKHPIKLGETISIKGKFTELGEEMYMEKCKIIYRSSDE